MNQEEINKNLQDQITELKNQLFDTRFVPKELKDNVLDIVLQDRDLVKTKTQTIELSGDPQNISVPLGYTGYIITRYRGNLIYIPFI